MTSKTQILVLEPSGKGGCVPHTRDWEPENDRQVAILNKSGYDQSLKILADNVLREMDASDARVISISSGGFWQGTVRNKGQYLYDDGVTADIGATGTRTGRIDPY